MHHTLTEYKRHLDDLEKIQVTPELTKFGKFQENQEKLNKLKKLKLNNV